MVPGYVYRGGTSAGAQVAPQEPERVPLPVPEPDVSPRQMLRFTVVGIPAPQGSAKAFVNKATGRASVTHSNKGTMPWRALVSAAAVQACQESEDERWRGYPLLGPVMVSTDFFFPRPKSHYRTGKFASELRADAPFFMKSRPDIDKLKRAVLDALTDSGFIYVDDAQVVRSHQQKSYVLPGQSPGVIVTVMDLAGSDGLL